MDMQIDRGRLDIERIRQEMDESHIKVGKILLDMEKTREDMPKNRADMALYIDRLRTQSLTMVATMIGAFAATLAAGAAIGHFFK